MPFKKGQAPPASKAKADEKGKPADKKDEKKLPPWLKKKGK